MALKEIEKLKEKVDKDPNSKLFVPLAEEYKKEGMLDEAIQVLLTGIERQPAYMSARVSLGKIYLEKGMRGEARAEFESVIKSIPDNLYAHKKLAEIYRASGEKELAIKSYRTILKLNSMDEDALSSLHELEGGELPKEAQGGPVSGSEPSEEDVLESHLHEAPSAEGYLDDSVPDSSEAEPFEPPRDDELNAFKESIFGDMGTGDGKEIIAQDLPEEEETLDSTYFAGEDVEEDSEDILAGVLVEEGSPVTEEIPGEGEQDVSEAVPDTRESVYDALNAKEMTAEKDKGYAEVSVRVEEADRKVSEGDFVGAIGIYRKVLADNPDDRKALQRMEELRGLLKMMGKDKEELISRLSGFLEGLQKRHNEFLRRT